MNEVMKLRFIEFAQKSGFCLWKGESWNPGDIVDWSCRYDKELQKFFESIVLECAKVCDEMSTIYKVDPSECADVIRKHFGVE